MDQPTYAYFEIVKQFPLSNALRKGLCYVEPGEVMKTVGWKDSKIILAYHTSCREGHHSLLFEDIFVLWDHLRPLSPVEVLGRALD